MVAHALIPALRRQRKANLCEFKASMVYRASSKTVGPTQRNPVLKHHTHTPQKEIELKKEVPAHVWKVLYRLQKEKREGRSFPGSHTM